MVVDDEPQNVRYVIDVLTWAGYENVEGLTDPIEAVNRFPDYQPDLVILDLLMPGMDGFDAMEAMREHLPSEEYLPFVILTSDISSESRRRALSSGAKDFLTKPMSPTEVRLRVENLLDTRMLYLELSAQSNRPSRSTMTATPDDGRPERDQEELLERWAASLEAALPDAEGRSKRVAWLSGQLAETLSLSSDVVERVRQAALLHLLGVGQSVAVAGGRADAPSWLGGPTDADAGLRILEGSSIPALDTARRMLSALDERWDGTGQPSGLRGEAIPIEARIVSAARYWDDAHGPGQAGPADETGLEALGGTRFDPAVIEALLRTRSVGA